MIGIQCLNLAYHYPDVYWNTACLIVNAGADEDVEVNKSTDYGKIATAISNMQKRGINVSLPVINSTNFGFIPDEKNNRIIYSIKAINGIGDDVARLLIKNRPYTSLEDFCERMLDTKLIKNSQMIALIKAGCFTELHSQNRKETMKYFIMKYLIQPVQKLTFAQFDRLMAYDDKYHFVPEELYESIAHKDFKEYALQDKFFYKYVVNGGKKVPKCGYHDRLFKLNGSAMKFFCERYSEESIVLVEDTSYVISEKKFIKENNTKLEPLKEWFTSSKAVNAYNNCMYFDMWEKYAAGTEAAWEMESLSIYSSQEHELMHINKDMYGVVDFFEMPEKPEAYSYFTRKLPQDGDYVQKRFPKYKITRIAGTVLDKNKDRHMISLLTLSGVVSVKFDKGQFGYYDRQISETNPNGTKTILEKSWFSRGNKLLICGYRNEDQFRAKKYTDTAWKHTCNLITSVKDNGSLEVLLGRGGEEAGWR